MAEASTVPSASQPATPAQADVAPAPPPRLEAPPQKSTDPVLRHRLASFFRFYEPSQLAILDMWLTNWAGKEKQMFAELVRFHGPEPDLHQRLGTPAQALSAEARVEASCRNLLQQTLLLYAPERIGDVEAVLAEWEGQLSLLQQRLQRQVSFREHVYRVFREHMPDRVREVPALLRMWLGREMELLKVLSRCATAVPGRPPHRKGSGNRNGDRTEATPERPALPFASYRDQLLHFYRLYNPDRVGDVDAILEQYRGREPALFRKLYKKYCKEPGPDTMDGAPTIARDGPNDAGEAAAAAPAEEDHASVRHLLAGTSLEQTAELDEFIRTFKGTDAELAWALRSFCRGAVSSPASGKSQRGIVLEQIAALEAKSASLHAQIATTYGAHSPQRNAASGAALGALVSDAAEANTTTVADRQPLDLAASLRAHAQPTQHERIHSMQVILSRVGLAHLAAKFVEEDLTPELLPTLTGVDLRELGVEPENERRAVLAKLKRLIG